MLAGYLPFDDDPANPEGDNINLLYKYIVSTPLTFPEYVTPHARDLLKRILVPDPRQRADLFEVARHSWLADYAHVVGFITTSNAAETAQQGSVYASKKLPATQIETHLADPPQKTHTNSHPRLPEVHLSASQPRPKRLRQYTVVLQPNEIRSTLLRSRRRLATTNAAPFRSNTLPLSLRPSAAKHHRLAKPHQRRLVLPNAYPNRQAQPQMATSLLPAQDRLALLDKEALPHRLARLASLRDQSRITLLWVACLQRQHGPRQAVRSAAPECHREATRTRSQQQLLWRLPTPKVASRSPRARTTPSLRPTLSRSLQQWASQALASQAHSKCSHIRSGPLADTPRVATSAPTLLLRRLVA